MLFHIFSRGGSYLSSLPLSSWSLWCSSIRVTERKVIPNNTTRIREILILPIRSSFNRCVSNYLYDCPYWKSNNNWLSKRFHNYIKLRFSNLVQNLFRISIRSTTVTMIYVYKICLYRPIEGHASVLKFFVAFVHLIPMFFWKIFWN